jgi:LacI family transcriptional regulator
MPSKLEDIARETGFSIATISRVLNNTDYPVKAAVRVKILEAAQRMDYQPNIMTRSLRTDRTNTIGILVDDLLSPLTPSVVRGIQRDTCVAPENQKTSHSFERSIAPCRVLLQKKPES